MTIEIRSQLHIHTKKKKNLRQKVLTKKNDSSI